MRAINIDVVCLFYFGGSYNDSWERWTTDRKQIQTYQKKSFKKINRRWENRRVKKISPSLSAWVIGRKVSHGITHGTQARKRTREDV